MSLSPDLKARVLQATRAESAPTRAQIRWRQGALFSAGLAAALAVFFIAGGVRPGPRPAALLTATSAGGAIIATLGLWLGLTRGRSMLGRPRAVLLALAIAAPVLLLGWKYGLGSAFDLAQRWPERPGFRCLRLSLLMGAVPLVASLFARAGSDPAHPGATGATLGVAVGVGVAFLVDLWCPVAYLPHLLLGHALPLLILATAGALLGARILRVRA